MTSCCHTRVDRTRRLRRSGQDFVQPCICSGSGSVTRPAAIIAAATRLSSSAASRMAERRISSSRSRARCGDRCCLLQAPSSLGTVSSTSPTGPWRLHSREEYTIDPTLASGDRLAIRAISASRNGAPHGTAPPPPRLRRSPSPRRRRKHRRRRRTRTLEVRRVRGCPARCRSRVRR